MNYLIWKTKAIIEGYFILKKCTLKTPVIGTCMPNGMGDIEAANKISSKYYRISLSQALQLDETYNGTPYCLLMENLDDSGNPAEGPIVEKDNQWMSMVSAIEKWIPRLKFKPQLILCQNEQNELSAHVSDCVRIQLGSSIDIPILQGPFTSCVESAGLKKYMSIFASKAEMYEYHALNFYLRPHWENKIFENFQRKCLLAYLVKELKLRGVRHMIITEANDGSTTRPGYSEVHGDMVYASFEGFNEIIEVAGKLGIETVLYYHAPFLDYPGNTV